MKEDTYEQQHLIHSIHFASRHTTTLPVMNDSDGVVVSEQNPYSSFAEILSKYHAQYSEAGPSSAQLDTPIRYDVVLDEDKGMVEALRGSLAN